MRTDKSFADAYSGALCDVDPETDALPSEEMRMLAGVDLCLTFLRMHARNEDISSVPFFLMGYPMLLGGGRSPELDRALTALRHLCGRFGAASAWVDACARYARLRETWRCYEIREGRFERRSAAPARVLRVLEEALARPVPWSESTIRVASPGSARVKVDHGRKVLVYDVPPVPVDRQQGPRYQLRRRSVNPPIVLEWRELEAVARRVDERELRADWPMDSLPPLNLAERLRKVKLREVVEGTSEPKHLVLDGATHIVGMLSSGKSTLVWAIVFALTLDGGGRRVAMIASDTIQGAATSARLRRHGVHATVLSSVRNRDRHFGAIQWRHSLSAESRSLSSLGDLTEGFATSCSLDGFQRDPDVADGEDNRVVWPAMHEKPCHRLYQTTIREGNDESEDQDVVDGNGLSCPLFNSCPAQSQQRQAVDAQVLVMTPQAFVHMTPDRWTTESRITFPELLQYTADLVIMDEVDSIQKAFDDTFAPRSPIMGDDQDVYAPTIGTRTSEALRARSGHQYRRAANARWQSNFHTLFRLIGILYAILQREGDSIGRFYKQAPFTSAGILGELWRIHQGTGRSETGEEREQYEARFVDVLRVASAIGQFSRASAVADDQESGARDVLGDVADDDLKRAGAYLRDLARLVLTSDYYEDLLEDVGQALSAQLAAFDARGRGAERLGEMKFDARSNAAALTLAVVTELVLAHYNWLIKAQPGVARDFDIDDGQLLSQANNLLRHYRTLLPANPAGSVFGLFYDEPAPERRHELGGKLTLVNHLGVGRHLIVHLHDLLAAEGQAGPHVLMLSGTSWAGGSRRATDRSMKTEVDLASPLYDVQVPVRGVLVQPEDELRAIEKSRFELFDMRNEDGKQVVVSGLPPPERRRALASIGERLGALRDGGNLLEKQWARLGKQWGAEALNDRRRTLLVVNSYADAAAVGDALVQSLHSSRRTQWTICSLVPDRDDEGPTATGPLLARALPRSLVERFGLFEEQAVLVAPLQVIARGHNILNRQSQAKAAISTIYFLHRPHPRPDDLAPAIARLNRLAVRHHGSAPINVTSVKDAGRDLRREAASTLRMALAMRDGYRALPSLFKAQFAWDMLTPVWQTIGRGIRGGSPVYVGFVDAKFAPRSFAGETDTPDSSVLVQSLRQLRDAFDSNNNHDAVVARRLYAPFYAALNTTEGLRHD